MRPVIPVLSAISLVMLVFAAACTVYPATPIPADMTPLASETPPPSESPSASTLVPFPTLPPPSPTAAPTTGTVVASPSPRTGPLRARPVAQLVSPLANTQLSVNQTVYVVALAASDNGISRIELFDDSVPVRTETPPTLSASFSAVIPWTPTTAGAHALRLVAYDAGDVAGVPDEINVTVFADARKPTATIVFPIGIPQVELGTVLQIYAIGTDGSGVTQLDLWIDNQLYTYVTAPNAGGLPELSNVFAWNPSSPGTHTLIVRAHDSQEQTTDSAPLKVFVADTHAPTLNVSFERTNGQAGEPITITVSALDVSGIQRIELWTGREISNTFISASPARQTYMTVQVGWQSANVGDYIVSARAYNANGNMKESPAQTISVLRPNQPTPTRGLAATPTRTRAPRPTATPRLQPPASPIAEISQPADRFVLTAPVRVTFSGKGSAELERVELWGYSLGQLSPQVICVLDAQATTQRTGQCDWSPNSAGPIFFFAQAIDIYNQQGRSSQISGLVTIPPLPTPTPTPASLGGRWSGTTTSSNYLVTIRPVTTASGVALRGDLRMTSIANPASDIAGRITSGLIKGNLASFRVEFTPVPLATITTAPDMPTPTAAPTVTPVAPALEWECTVDSTATSMDCKFKDSRGLTGAVVLKRETSP